MKNFIRTLALVCAVLSLNGIASIAKASPSGHLPAAGPASITVDPAIATGGVLWSGTVDVFHEDRRRESFRLLYKGTGRYLENNLYATELPGVALRIKFADKACAGVYWPTNCALNGQNLIVELVKTGSITNGGSLSGIFGSMSYGKGYLVNFVWRAPVIIGLGFPTCSIITSSIAVNLGDNIPLSTFSGVGSVSSSRKFNIALRCAGGGTGAVTNVHTTLTDQTSPANTSDTLSLSPGSTASGVGIQVINGASVVKYGPDSKAVGNTNQWKAGATGNGVLNIPLAARYIQTGSVVSAGTANARATFTMSYQ
jgi:type 1 fimbria pilin